MNRCKLILIVLISAFSCTVLADNLASNADTSDTQLPRELEGPKRILFTGNSFSFYNNGIHNHLGGLIRASGAWKAGENRMRLMTLSGAHIYENLPSIKVMLNRKDEKWDAIVLQGHSNEPVTKEKRQRFSKAIDMAVEMAKEKSVSPILFMTWEYKGNSDMGVSLSETYQSIAKKHKIMVVPVGLAFAKAQIEYPDIELYHPDVLGLSLQDAEPSLRYKKTLKHPSSAGTYLAACVFYATLYQQSPQGLLFRADLPTAKAEALQKLSWQVVKEFSK